MRQVQEHSVQLLELRLVYHQHLYRTISHSPNCFVYWHIITLQYSSQQWRETYSSQTTSRNSGGLRQRRHLHSLFKVSTRLQRNMGLTYKNNLGDARYLRHTVLQVPKNCMYYVILLIVILLHSTHVQKNGWIWLSWKCCTRPNQRCWNRRFTSESPCSCNTGPLHAWNFK